MAQIIYIECETIYISPSISRAGCPPESLYDCFYLSQISDHLIMSHGSSITLLFLPGKHTLITNLTINHYSYFTMKSSNRISRRPVINCQHLSNLQFFSITSISIDGLKFTGCLENRILNIEKFIIKDSIFVGKNLPPGRAIIVTQSIMHVIRSSFDFFNSPDKQNGGALTLFDSSCNISYSNFTNNNANCGSAI